MTHLNGKVALITGAGSGIGKATAVLLAKLVMFLSSDAARNITGTEVWIDGASSLVKG